MKKITLILVAGLVTLLSAAQDKPMSAENAKLLVKSFQQQTHLSLEEIDQSIVTSAYTSSDYGITYVYLNQAWQGMPVYNQIKVLAFRNGKLMSNAGDFIPNLKQNASSLTHPVFSAEHALQKAATHVGALQPKFQTVALPQEGNIFNFGKLGIAYEDVTAQLMWVPATVSGKKLVKLAWNINLAPIGTDDFWSIRIDANTNEVIEKNNFTVFEKAHNHENGNKRTAHSSSFVNEEQPEHIRSSAMVNNATYTVIPFPFESPSHSAAANVSNPWTLAGAFNPNAVSLKWHSDGTTDYDITRGNNVWATEDRSGANSNSGNPGISTTSPDPVTFINVPDYTVDPTTANFQQFATVNLFYWNNIVHDMMYNYGFNEVSGNFQANNQGRGGLGNDHVMALAQSGSGTNNANFSTPADGGRGRMRMYLWTAPNPDRDGDLDNGVVVHEYAHGISNRLTGGPAAAGCLSNAEQAGEGWSDYFALMMTTDWATALPTDGATKPRGVGTYVRAQVPTGSGIRNYKYCTDMMVNPLTYARMNGGTWGEVHNTGEIWCSALWDMTWFLIQQDGINPNMFNASGAGGNSKALKLVTEGLRLQNCSPGFLDSRDAILRADSLLYNGANRCVIMQAFARRGMGFDAKQGSSSSTSDQTAGYSTKEIRMTSFSPSVVQQNETFNITFTTRIYVGPCEAASGYIIRDTLPTNVTWVSGGTYDAATRVVSFTINQAPNTTQAYAFTVNVNAGSYFPTVNLFEDQVPAGAVLPNTKFTAATNTFSNWIVSNTRSFSNPNSYFSQNGVDVDSDQTLTMVNGVALPVNPPNFTFWNFINSEGTYDGGVLEISTDNGTTWNDVGNGNFISGGYNATFSTGTTLAGRQCWSGNMGGWVKTKLNLNSWANQTVKLRFRYTTDVGTAVEGWYVDDIAIIKAPVVEIKSVLYTPTNSILQALDTLVAITPAPVSCVNVSVTSQPAAVSVCPNNNATFSVTASGTNPSYQWQVSTTGCGGTFTNIAGATAATYTANAVTSAMNGYAYRVIISNTCPSTITSNCVLLNVNNNTAAITTNPSNTTVCSGATATFTAAASGAGFTYQWQVSTNGGTNWSDIAGATNASYTTAATTTAMNNNQYRVRVVASCSDVTSTVATLSVNSSIAINTQPANATTCAGVNATFSVSATGTSPSYQWQLSTTGCAGSFTNIAGATAASYTVTNPTSGNNGYAYRVVVTNTCGTVTSNCATLSVTNNALSITADPSPTSVCAGATASFMAAANGTGAVYQWQVSSDGGTTWTDVSAPNTATLTLANTTASMNNNRYRLKVTSPCNSTGVTSNSAILTVNTTATITSQPQSIAKCTGAAASFSVAATGATTYQWQVSVSGGAFTNIAGATSTTYNTTIGAADNGTKYRVIIGSPNCGTITSNEATITFPNAATISISQSGTLLTASVAPAGTYTYQWYRNGNAIIGANAATYTMDYDSTGNYAVRVNDPATSCSTLSAAFNVSIVSNNLFYVGPNPTSGITFISYIKAPNDKDIRSISVMDSKGALIMKQASTLSTTSQVIKLNLNGLASGLYTIVALDADGKILKTAKLLKR